LEKALKGIATSVKDIQPKESLNIYNVKRILASRVSRKRIEYLIKWLDWDDIHNT
jgi:Chromo (CHRromatin Organisation MOdifier) domain